MDTNKVLEAEIEECDAKVDFLRAKRRDIDASIDRTLQLKREIARQIVADIEETASGSHA